ncbi:MAG: sulfatase-like hydrolase/transferase [Pirellulales bacterium]|nr:sulfatase-like hydrolase/transferase [Pirellulales bacterium]
MRTFFQSAIFFLIANCALFLGTGLAIASNPPNIIYIIVDDAGLGDFTSFTPSSPVNTPNLDALAASGKKFTNAYAGAPVCAPSRSALMTGYHMGHAPMRHNGGGVNIFHSEVTVAEVLKGAGYNTGGFGKWGLGNPGTTGAAERQGFDEFYGYYNQVHAHNHYSSFLIDSGRIENIPENVGAPRNGLVSPQHSHSFNLYTDKMKDYVRDQAQSGEPFFAYGAWTPPHHDNSIPSNEPLYQQYANVPGWNQATKIQATFISMIDREVGNIMNIVNDPDGNGNNSDSIANNTLIMFVSDNGGAQNTAYPRNPGLRDDKGSVYEGGLRVPMIASWANTITPGTTSDVLTSFTDVMPTLAELAGASASVPQDIDGLSLVPTLTGQGTQMEHESLYFEFDRSIGDGVWEGLLKQAVVWDQEVAGVTTTWKAVKPNPSSSLQLFKLKVNGTPVDSDESNNIAAANPTIVAHMQMIMQAERVQERIQLDTNPRDGKITPFGLRPTVRTVAPLASTAQQLPSGSGGASEYTIGLEDGANDPWVLYLDDFEQAWTVDLLVGRPASGDNAPSTLLVELLGDGGFSYLSKELDTGSIAPGMMQAFSLDLDLTSITPGRGTVTSDLGGGLTLRLANIGTGGQILIDQTQLLVASDFLPGDFSGNLVIDLPDWNILVSNLLKDTSEMSFQDAYALGDLDNSGQVGMEDFLAFRQTWEVLYGTAALAQLSTSVPEPGTGVLLASTLVLLLRRHRQVGCGGCHGV